MAEHNEIGKIGERIAKTFLMKHGFSVLETNYRTRLGEIDIIAKKDDVLRFVEVKSVKVRDFESYQNQPIQPEDNLTGSKYKKIVASLETYLFQKHIPEESRYQIDLACVYVDTEKRAGMVKFLENVQR